MNPEPHFPSLIERALDSVDLSADESAAVFGAIMAGSASGIETAGWLIALRAKGVAASEVAGGARALRDAMVRVPIPDPDSLVDTAGTGGGTVTTFNVSTAAAIAAAGAGARVAKHGNRSFTSKCGSADVLEALGVEIDLRPQEMAKVLGETGMVFMFAPNLHPAMRHVAPVRRGLGTTTVMNLLGPLSNPAGAKRQVVGVSDPAMIPLVAGALAELGCARAMVVHGEPGMDEISPCGSTRIAEIREESVAFQEIEPEELGVERCDPAKLQGGSPAENARALEAVVTGEPGARRSATVLNAAAAIWAAGLVETLEKGVDAAARSLDSGDASAVLEKLRSAGGRAGSFGAQ